MLQAECCGDALPDVTLHIGPHHAGHRAHPRSHHAIAVRVIYGRASGTLARGGGHPAITDQLMLDAERPLHQVASVVESAGAL